MHQITNRGIFYEVGVDGFCYPVFQESSRGKCYRVFEGEVLQSSANTKEELACLRTHYETLEYYDAEKNAFSVTKGVDMTACSLFDIAFCRQDRNDRDLIGMNLVSTEVSHALRSAYNHGLIQILGVHAMNTLLLEKAIRKIHTEESIAPYLLAKGLSFVKEGSGWEGIKGEVTIEGKSIKTIEQDGGE